jgi:hypothetical protein
MNSVLGDALQKALDAKKNDYSNFVWKGEKRKEGDKYVQESEKISEMSPERLKECWNHCEKMLRNDDPKHLGRYNVLEEVTSQINKCNTELLLRYFENTYQKRENGIATKRFSLMISLRQFQNNNPEITDLSSIPFVKITENLPDEFSDISISDVLDGCTDNLGAFNKQHLTMTFITKMGLWFTKAEENELKGNNNSNTERLRVAKERLHLPTKLILRFSEKGLSYHEMRAMLTLPKKQKYSDMTTEQLVTLRNKVLLRLSREIDGHIFSWKRLQKQIELVAKSKNIDLND